MAILHRFRRLSSYSCYIHGNYAHHGNTCLFSWTEFGEYSVNTPSDITNLTPPVGKKGELCNTFGNLTNRIFSFRCYCPLWMMWHRISKSLCNAHIEEMPDKCRQIFNKQIFLSGNQLDYILMQWSQLLGFKMCQSCCGINTEPNHIATPDLYPIFLEFCLNILCCATC